MKGLGLCLGRHEIRPRRGRILGAIQVLGMKYRVPIAEPCGRTGVQLALTALEQRRIDAFLDQRMGEQIVTGFGPDQEIGRKPGAVVTRIIDQVPQGLELEALADHGSSLQRLLVSRRKPVHAREHQALDRRRNRFVRALLGVA